MEMLKIGSGNKRKRAIGGSKINQKSNCGI